jgi:hypothetical protein
MTTNPDGPPAAVRRLRRIGIWGAPQSGKTTFLAALNVAVIRAPQDHLLIYGVDENSTEFLIENTEILTTQRKFPDATANLRQFSWAINMQTQVRVRKSRWRETLRAVPMQLNIDVIDAPGGAFESGMEERQRAANLGYEDEDQDEEQEAAAPMSVPDEVIEHLASCDGILFLFDPLRERKQGDTYRYFHGTLLRIAQRRLVGGPGGSPGIGRLPQHVAVCITKFDDPRVYEWARQKGYRTIYEDDPYLFPRVRDEEAAPFFADLCRESERSNADLVLGALGKFFWPERTRYFVTSAIGFYLGPASRFTESNYQNVVPDGNGTPYIRGPIHPINVVEPLLWLGQCFAAPVR